MRAAALRLPASAQAQSAQRAGARSRPPPGPPPGGRALIPASCSSCSRAAAAPATRASSPPPCMQHKHDHSCCVQKASLSAWPEIPRVAAARTGDSSCRCYCRKHVRQPTLSAAWPRAFYLHYRSLKQRAHGACPHRICAHRCAIRAGGWVAARSLHQCSFQHACKCCACARAHRAQKAIQCRGWPICGKAQGVQLTR